MFFGLRGHSGEIAGKSLVRPLFLLIGFSVQSKFSGSALKQNSLDLWVGRAKHPGPAPPCHFAVEVFNVGGWLTHGDLALETRVDFLAVVGHRLIPARVRSEWARLNAKGLASIWAPASQDSSHVGNAGVGVISLSGAPVSLPTFAIAVQEDF